ncbi:class II glutamine amidotransferase [Nocardia nepalensis]|uniref:class II glutamine amidotransferase n=1 Tax=Nocardia nepalensis TaxID=3375448 RepID=UPI003B67B1C5
MCILTFIKPGANPDLDALRGGALTNPHGHGYAIITGDTITVGRGMDPDAVIAEFASVRMRFPDGAALFHSRLATHGVRDVENCHPFIVGGDARTVLAHNGILPDEVHPSSGDPRSDTRIAAEELLPRRPFGSLDSWAGRERLERWLGTDKMVLLTVDPAYRYAGYIFNERRGHWDQGSWYSNNSYLHGMWATAGDSDWDWCENCGVFNENPMGPHCVFCGYCADCFGAYPHCDCPALAGQERYADLFDLESA